MKAGTPLKARVPEFKIRPSRRPWFATVLRQRLIDHDRERWWVPAGVKSGSSKSIHQAANRLGGSGCAATLTAKPKAAVRNKCSGLEGAMCRAKDSNFIISSPELGSALPHRGCTETCWRKQVVGQGPKPPWPPHRLTRGSTQGVVTTLGSQGGGRSSGRRWFDCSLRIVAVGLERHGAKRSPRQLLIRPLYHPTGVVGAVARLPVAGRRQEVHRCGSAPFRQGAT